MCGIVGIIHEDPRRRVDEGQLVAMREALVRRGPDDSGTYIGAGAGLGSRRLAILDISERGRMPMASRDGRFRIVHNGEIYNYQEIKGELVRRGCVFQTGTDTEVLLELYAVEGAGMLERLNGMFAFAIWDTVERRLFMARDRLGIKPLCYKLTDESLLFASEEKALFAGGVPMEFDYNKWEELLCFRYVAGEETVFRGVKRLLPGHYLIWERGEAVIRRWWDLGGNGFAKHGRTEERAEDWFRRAFDGAVESRRISDVPVGVLLSGGLDSCSVAGSLANAQGRGVNSFTVRFNEPEYDETSLAKDAARAFGLEYHELSVPGDELLTSLKEASFFNDEPLAHGSDLYLMAIARLAKEQVTVLLSGEGADELLGGYVRYRPLRYPRLVEWAHAMEPLYRALTRGSNGRLGKLGRFLKEGGLREMVFYNACNVLPSDLPRVGLETREAYGFRRSVMDDAERVFPGEPMRQAMYLDTRTFLGSLLHRNDRMTMGASVECRVPFLDVNLVEGLLRMSSAGLTNSWASKPLLRRAVGRRLPKSVLNGRKWGFGVPWVDYFRENPDLREYLMGLWRCKAISESPMDLRLVKGVVSDFLNGSNENFHIVNQLMMTALWQESYEEGIQSLRRNHSIEERVA